MNKILVRKRGQSFERQHLLDDIRYLKKNGLTFAAGQLYVADVLNEHPSTVRRRLDRMLAESNVNPQLLPDTWYYVFFSDYCRLI